jgi:hypothetical protein
MKSEKVPQMLINKNARIKTQAFYYRAINVFKPYLPTTTI